MCPRHHPKLLSARANQRDLLHYCSGSPFLFWSIIHPSILWTEARLTESKSHGFSRELTSAGKASREEQGETHLLPRPTHIRLREKPLYQSSLNEGIQYQRHFFQKVLGLGKEMKNQWHRHLCSLLFNGNGLKGLGDIVWFRSGRTVDTRCLGFNRLQMKERELSFNLPLLWGVSVIE